LQVCEAVTQQASANNVPMTRNVRIFMPDTGSKSPSGSMRCGDNVDI